MIGQTISHYKILEKLGEGGMGVVYKAEDTRLDRIVAIKFLPRDVASDEEDRKRFEIEAKAAAALNHPNIATIHAIEEVDDEIFIVMEYIEGRELKEMEGVPKKTVGVQDPKEMAGVQNPKDSAGVQNFEPLPIAQILNYAAQVAGGLQAAHEKGIIHRDIKSANIMITEKGQVKIMDFGLAKVRGGAGLTEEHSTLGTAEYMSPEQALGEAIDSRTDIWSFGVVLYEMLTREMPFRGEQNSAILLAILNKEPLLIADSREDVPVEIEQITYKCLQKDREHRYQSAEQLLTDLKKLRKSTGSGKRTPAIRSQAGTRKGTPRSFVIAAILVLALALVVTGYNLLRKKISEPRIVDARALTTTTAVQEVNPHISPDGTKVAYASAEEGKWDLMVRQIASGQTINLTKDEKSFVGGYAWSPDGNWIAYSSARNGGGIYVISEYGGAARRIVAHSYEDLGALNWSPDGKKLAYIMKGKLYTVLASGGVPEHIPLPRDADDPAWSPDGERILLILGPEVSAGLGPFIRSGIWTIRPDGSDAIAVFDEPGSLFSPTWANDGKRIFFKWYHRGTRDIWWVPVEKNGKPTGSARPLTTGLNTYDFSLSSDGSKLTYATGGNNINIWSLPLGVDRLLALNDALQITHENQTVYNLATSPDHKWLAFNSNRLDGRSNIWLMGEDGQNLRQLTADSSHNFYPCWSADGSRIAFSSDQTGNMDIYIIPVDGGPATALTADPAVDEQPSWSPDGGEIVFHSNRSGNFDLWAASVRGGETGQLTDDPADDVNPRYSPDGRFISFVSNRTGTWDLYLLPTAGGETVQLTHFGATRIMGHVWSLDSKAIYYNTGFVGPAGKGGPGNEIWAVSVDDGSIGKILDFTGDSVNWLSQSMATDGERLFFIVGQPLGDIWLAELVYK